MQTHLLAFHPQHPPLGVTRVEAKIIGRDANWVRVRWRVEGSQNLVVPPFAGRGRADDLWQTTCFEVFLKPDGEQAYVELNLSPSERWNAYDFSAYRWGMTERPFPREPECTLRLGSSFAIFDAAIPVAGLPGTASAMGLCAVVEEQGGVKSYWALAHSDAKPDFHAPACFTATLPAPEAA
ncbi:MAG TPA: DOMON-like domain-containing protein [Croceibacterium sp.]|nr:DOMON-like domain-containing protein [Croceibacterium sp.]